MKKHKLRFSSRTANAQKQTNSAPLSFFRVRCRLAGRQKTTKPEKFRKFPRTFKSPKQSNLAPSANRCRCVVLCQKTLKKLTQIMAHSTCQRSSKTKTGILETSKLFDFLLFVEAASSREEKTHHPASSICISKVNVSDGHIFRPTN